MARYSVRERRWYGLRRDRSPPPPPAEDCRQWRTELPGGLVRIDMGEPTPRLSSEPQPVSLGSPSASPSAPASEPAEPAEAFAAMLPKDVRPGNGRRDWRRDYGLLKAG